jgi:hypothetical protein
MKENSVVFYKLESMFAIFTFIHISDIIKLFTTGKFLKFSYLTFS